MYLRKKWAAVTKGLKGSDADDVNTLFGHDHAYLAKLCEAICGEPLAADKVNKWLDFNPLPF